METINEEISSNIDQIFNDPLENDIENELLRAAETLSPIDDSLVESNESTPKRKRGRPKKDKERRVNPIEPRLNPVRNARSKRVKASEIVDDELVPSTSSEDPVISTKRTTRKKISTKRKQNESVKPRGRPKKIVKKPICVVRPMPQSGNENKPKKCGWSSCSHTANSVRSLKTHVEGEHLNHLTQYTCRWIACPRSSPFKALYMLSLHLRSHIGIKPFECTICGKTYTRQENLRTHQRMHNNERPFNCRVCGKGFISASDRSKHQQRTHSNTKAYKCPVEQCSKEYTDPSSLRKHLKKIHGGDVFAQAKLNKQRNGPGNNYGIIPSNDTFINQQPSTSREIY